MPTVATIDGIRLLFYANDHPPPHFHALFAEHRAVIDIETMKLVRGELPKAKLRRHQTGVNAASCFAGSRENHASSRQSGEDSMKRLPRIASAEPVVQGVLKLVFNDAYEGVVDLGPIIAKGRIFSWLQKPKNFQKVKLEEYGHHVYWTDNRGQEIDLGADSLRRNAEKQAGLHRLIAS